MSDVLPFPGAIEAAIAADLLERLERHLGYRPQVEQVDFEDCEGTGDLAAYIYWGRGADEFTMLSFQRPELTCDMDAVEEEMCRPIPVDPAALAEQLRRPAVNPEREDDSGVA